MEHKNLWDEQGEVPEDDGEIPIGVARLDRAGDDVTIVTWSAALQAARQAADDAAAKGISVEILDLRSLWPWDEAAVLESVAKTGRLLVVHEAVKVCGFGAEVAATVSEAMGGGLKAPVRRLGAPRIPIPYAPPLEDLCRVRAADVMTVFEEMGL